MNQFAILRQFREAKRDAALAQYGSDWRKHFPHPGFWNAEPNDDEEREHLRRTLENKLD
jgi:hypothetical protein